MYLEDVVLPKLLLTRALRCAESMLPGRAYAYWQRESVYQRPLAGFDCSASYTLCGTNCWDAVLLLKLLATYFLLALLKKGEALEEGDLIWYNGHVMIVSDVKKNRLIEAAGYESGWGKVHEIALDKVFNKRVWSAPCIVSQSYIFATAH